MVSRNFFSAQPGLNFLTSNIRELNPFSVYSTTAWFAPYRKHSGSSDLSIANVYCCRAKPAGAWTGLWGATSATSYTSFSAKGKAKSARSAVCANIAFVFTSRMPKRTRKPKQPGIYPARGGACHGPRSISSFAATASTTSSSHGRPTICTPIGRPSSEEPIGTTTAGKPSKLNHSQ